MATPESLAGTVRTAITSGTASPSTVTTLQTLLSSVPRPASQLETTSRTASKTTATTRATKTTKPSRPAARNAKKDQEFQVHEDSSRTLPPKARYALATEVINISLKVLSEATAPASKGQRRESSVARSNGSSTPRRHSRTSSLSQRALQLRSGNATPVRQSPVKRSALTRTESQCSVGSVSPSSAHRMAVAECARLSFSLLGSAEVQKLGVRPLPKLQLELGMLSLVGMLITLRFDALAVRELRTIKRRLESLQSIPGKKRPAGSKNIENETLASLLCLELDFEAHPDALSVAITYQLHVLRVITLLRKPATIEDVLQYLVFEHRGSPANLLLLSVDREGGEAKAVRQLEALAQMLLQLCPSVSGSADEAARDPHQSPSPLTVFRLQILALQVRQKAWQISKRPIDIQKEVADPFSKCLSTLVRRMPSRKQAPASYDACTTAYSTMSLASKDGPSMGNGTITRTFALLADGAAFSDQSYAWATSAVESCGGLDRTHARYLAAIALRLSLSFGNSPLPYDQDNVLSDLLHLSKSLSGKPVGSKLDYEQLIADLSRLACTKPGTNCNEDAHRGWTELVQSAAGFASRCASLLPASDVKPALAIVNAALLLSKTSDELLSWVSKDTARLMKHAGALRAVAESAASMPMARAWSSTSLTIALTRVLRALALKAASTEGGKPSAIIFDDDNLDPDESGAVLEWQLNCVLEVAHKPKYQNALQILIPHMLQRLLMFYSATTYPIRCTRIAALAMRVREQFPEFLPPGVLQPFLGMPTVDVNALGKDNGLENYAPDINASFRVSLAFYNGPVTTSELETHLQVWQNIIETSRQSGTLDHVVDSPSVLLSQLTSLEEYAGVMGDDLGQLRIAYMLLHASELADVRDSDMCSYGVRVASGILSLGHAESAGKVLEKHKQLVNDDTGTPALEYYLCKAEQLLALDEVQDCQRMMEKAHEFRLDLVPNKIRSHQSKSYKLLHGRGWLLQSRCFLAAGLPHDSLRAAKRSAKVMNSIWSGIERASGQKPQPDMSEIERESAESSLENLGKKVSKLNLNPGNGDSKTTSQTEVRGAAFWPAARLLCRALMHLSDVYAHHGVFNEANYSSEQALRIAESIQSPVLLSRVRSHRSVLLTAAGRIEDAELVLAQDESDASTSPSLAAVERLQANCALSLKTCELEDALKHTHESLVIVRSIQSDDHVIGMEPSAVMKGTTSRNPVESQAGAKTTSRAASAKQPPRPRVVAKPSRAVVFNKSTKRVAAAASSQGHHKDGKNTCYVLQKLEAQLTIQGAMICLKLGRQENTTLTRLNEALLGCPVSFAQCQLEHESTMRKVATTLEADFAYNVLPESTLSFPAIQAADLLETQPTSTVAKPAAKSKKPVKGGKRRISSHESLESLLWVAQQCLTLDASITRLFSTYDTHRQYSMLSNTAMLLSATSAGCEVSALRSLREALAVDYSRMRAAECQLVIAELEKETFQASDLLIWPTSESCEPASPVTADAFQEHYVNILPAPWTAVSLGLNEECNELYITRYRRGQSPLVLRLPFSRQKSEDADDEMFDYHMARDELREIIELSNYSCHNPIDAGAKTAKTDWWSEREALDMRLHELLLNIENIWLGGFRGAFSQHARDTDKLSRFRKDFEVALDRHLPSRRATKRGSTKFSLDDQVLELFIGLESDQDGDVDLDEPLSDLLYFVVDMLQFGGERNAYDEVDFDSMAIEVLDALRSYHDSVDVEDQDGAHLILVLDRRLQAFPWESLPCLQNASVSRVDSMLCLRDRIEEMRTRYGKESDRYTVTRRSGSYILNPSADLKNTEASLAPDLARLSQADGADWKAIVRREPTEAEFSNALTTSSTLLYFGHGAGSQYIRPRAIRHLERCSEVVWLMGCSSGAVTEHDELEPHAVPMAYLVAGQRDKSLPSNRDQDSTKCMSVLATLWDVTDKDIDRFSLAVGEEWGLWSSPRETSKAPVKTPRKREVVAAPLTPQRGAKTPKTPKVRKTPAPARTPARSRSRARVDVGKKQSLVQAVAKSRDACYLRYLNGAAPVVYGVPVYLGE